MITFEDNITKKHQKEIKELESLGVVSGGMYEGKNGEVRFISWLNYQKGCISSRITAFNEGETGIYYIEGGKMKGEGKTCTVSEWLKWMGGVSKTVDAKREKTSTEKMADAKAKLYEHGGLKTKPFPKPKDGNKWKSPNKNKKS